MDELAAMDGGKCILQIRGVRPFFSDKYDITQHPNYKYLSDADPANTFDIGGYLNCRMSVDPETSFDAYEVDVSEEADVPSDADGNP